MVDFYGSLRVSKFPQVSRTLLSILADFSSFESFSHQR